MLLHRKAAQIKRIHKKSKYFSGVSFGKTKLFVLCHLRSEENAEGASRQEAAGLNVRTQFINISEIIVP